MPLRPPVGLTRTLLALLVALGLGGCAAVEAPGSGGSGSRPWLVHPEPERPGVPDSVMLGDRVGSFHQNLPGL